MSPIRETSGSLSGAGQRIGIVASRFNAPVVEKLVAAAVDCLPPARGGAAGHPPGAGAGGLGDPGGAGGAGRPAAASTPSSPSASVIRGETAHFDLICAECARGVAGVTERHRIPVGFGVLTCETTAQAEERAAGKAGSKGWEAALAALEMADLFARLRD